MKQYDQNAHKTVLEKVEEYISGERTGWFDPNAREHFLKLACSTTLSAVEVARLSEEDAHSVFAKLRWPETDGKPVCPGCGFKKCYILKTRNTFKCAACFKQFSVTSGTILHSRKKDLRDYLFAIAKYVNGAKGHSALELRRDLGVAYKTAFVWLHKIREAIDTQLSQLVLFGEVEVDGAYFGGYERPPNRGRRGRYSKKRWKTKECIFALCQRNGPSVATVISGEKRDEVEPIVKRHVATRYCNQLGEVTLTTLYADEAACYNILAAHYDLKRINHGNEYSNHEACTNQAESFHARVKRAEKGQYHRISGGFLQRYAQEMAFRTNKRRTDNATIVFELIELMMSSSISREWKGYWRNRITG